MLKRTSFLWLLSLPLFTPRAVLSQQGLSTVSLEIIIPSDSLCSREEAYEMKRLAFYCPSGFGEIPAPQRNQDTELIPASFIHTRRYYEFPANASPLNVNP